MGKLKKSYSERVVSYRSPVTIETTVKEMFFVLICMLIEEWSDIPNVMGIMGVLYWRTDVYSSELNNPEGMYHCQNEILLSLQTIHLLWTHQPRRLRVISWAVLGRFNISGYIKGLVYDSRRVLECWLLFMFALFFLFSPKWLHWLCSSPRLPTR